MRYRQAVSANPRNALLLAHLGRGGTVLTSGRREARHLRRLHDAAQLAAGREVWPTADVMPLAAWMATRWAEIAAVDATLPTLLDEGQAVWPWRTRVDEEPSGSLLAAHDLAGAARNAWIALGRYAGTLDLLDLQAMTRDQRMFQGWARQVEADLASCGWLDPGLLEVALAAQARRLGRGRDLLLAGFTRRAPALDRMLESLARGGWSVKLATASEASTYGHLYAASEPEDELKAIANWLRVRLLEDPAASLAVIVPDLPSRRDVLERILESTLQPELELPGAQERDRVFDLAGGPPLAGLGVADAALSCLDASGGGVQAPVIGRLLLSRYVSTGDSNSSRTRLELRLRRTGVAEWPVAALASFARQEACPGVAQALEAVAACREAPRQRSVERWAQSFGDVLAAWRWPGDEALTSDEYQAAQALRDRLSHFAALARTAPPMGFEAALTEFGRLAQGPYQPERGDPGVLVFDRLEALGVGFDGLWVAGLGAPAWPRAASPDPFIPVWIQERLGMPGASGPSSLADALATTEAWLSSAEEVVFSWPVRQDDARIEKSRVLPPDLAALAATARTPGQATSLFSAGGAEVLGDDPAPPLDPRDARGGSRIFELQSQCPFRAFAELRLGATVLEQPRAGVDARSRGSVLHRVLDLLWGALGSRAGLDQADASLQTLVEGSIERALSERLPAGVGRHLWELERDWQRAAVACELELERERGEFEVIAREDPIYKQLAGLPLTVIPDRADRLPDGSTVLIDYKTGDPKIGHWQGARPDQPQLPLYAILLGEEVSGIAFAAVSAKRARYIGVGRSEDLLPALKPAEAFHADGGKQAGYTWEEIRRGWIDTLTALAHAHLNGEATVSPKALATCRYCHLTTLCRVSVQAPEAEESEGG